MEWLLSLTAEIIVFTLLFLGAIFPLYMLGRWMYGRRSKAKLVNSSKLPLVGDRVRTAVKKNGREVEATGTLVSYGFVNGGRAIVRYLKDVVVDGEQVAEWVDMKGEGVEAWFEGLRIGSRDELLDKLDLRRPGGYDALSLVGEWRGRGLLEKLAKR